MAIGTSIADILNQWDAMGIFSYALPFLLLFAVVFGILEKSKIFAKDGTSNKGVDAIIALAIALLSLQFDFVSTFFATIFPRFGVGIAIFLVLILLAGLFYKEQNDRKTFFTIGMIIAAAVILWAITSWNFWGDPFGISWWFEEYFWAIVIGILIIVGIGAVIGFGGGSSGGSSSNKPAGGG